MCQRLLLAWYFIVHRGQTSLEIIMCDFANASKGIRICWSYLTCNVYHMHIHFTSTLWIINLGCRFMEPFIICGVRFWVWLTWASFLLGPICLHQLNFRILCCELFGNVDFRKVPLVKSTPPLPRLIICRQQLLQLNSKISHDHKGYEAFCSQCQQILGPAWVFVL